MDEFIGAGKQGFDDDGALVKRLNRRVKQQLLLMRSFGRRAFFTSRESLLEQRSG
jgi:hypothetical protein